MYKRYAEGVLCIDGLYKVFYTDDIYNVYNLKKTSRRSSIYTRPLEGLQSIETLKMVFRL